MMVHRQFNDSQTALYEEMGTADIVQDAGFEVSIHHIQKACSNKFPLRLIVQMCLFRSQNLLWNGSLQMPRSRSTTLAAPISLLRHLRTILTLIKSKSKSMPVTFTQCSP